jgi:hypothetical protein
MLLLLPPRPPNCMCYGIYDELRKKFHLSTWLYGAWVFADEHGPDGRDGVRTNASGALKYTLDV